MAPRHNPGKIVITTPTGHVGSRVVQLLIQAGVRPTLLLRDPTKLDTVVRECADIVVGDLTDADLVVHATRGAEAVFWVNPPTGDEDPIASHARLGANAARAVSQNGIARTVFLSSVGAEKRFGAGEIDGLARTEEQLDDTGANVLQLRCGYFFTNLFMDLVQLRAGTLPTTWPLDLPMAWVDPRDIGEIVAANLLSDGWSGRHVQAVHGPEDLTFSRVAEILSHAVGHRITPERISDDDLRTSLHEVGLLGAQIEGIVGMSIGLRENFTAENPRSVLSTTPTTLGAWAYQHLRPAL